MEGASSRFIIESSGLMKQELWLWVMWDVYEWYLLFIAEQYLEVSVQTTASGTT